MQKALEGVRVLEISQFWAGPLTASYLADLGAEVIKVETPGAGDRQRSPKIHGPGLKGENLVFLTFNRNKKSITLDLYTKKGQEIFKELVKKSDILIENFTPGTIKRFGFSYKSLSEINSRIIMVSISGYGQDGPYKLKPSFDYIGQAMGGLMGITGYPDHPPVRVGVMIADELASLFSVYGVLAALYWRERSGKGQWVDVSIMDSVAFTLGDRIVRYAALGNSVSELLGRWGNAYPYVVATDLYEAKDGYVILSAALKPWKDNWARIIGIEEFKDGDPNKVTDYIAEWARTKTVSEIIEIVEGSGNPCCRIISVDELIRDPQFLSREMLVEIEHPKAGEVKVMGVVPKLSATPGEVKTSAPLLGQHNEEVYTTLLQYSKQKIESLKEEKVI